jgi:hypothetical protein
MTSADLQTAVTGAVADLRWLADAQSRVAASPAAVAGLFPAVSRHCGRGPLPDPAPELARGGAGRGDRGTVPVRGRGREACGAARAAVAGHRGRRGGAAA